jgi:hypothetical protein
MVTMKTVTLVQLPTLDRVMNGSGPELRTLYTDIMKHPPPKRASHDFLRGNLAWTVQALASKQDPTILRTLLAKRASHPDTHHKSRYNPGTRLIREWQGQTHEVIILDQGYLWQGERYRSLSQIAQAITGTRWSGPRFFGIRNGD